MRRSQIGQSRPNRGRWAQGWVFVLLVGCGSSETTPPAASTQDAAIEDGSSDADASPPADATVDGSADGTAPGVTLHFGANPHDDIAGLQALGFDLVDVAGSTSNPNDTRANVDALPAGMQALVWVGNMDRKNCTTPDFTEAEFEAVVDALAGDPKVFGYYVADEPHPMACPNAPSDLKTRADYIHAHAPGQRSFITIVDGTNSCGGSTIGCEYSALRPSATDIDLFGLDPYPCHYDTTGAAVACDFSEIGERVSAAQANGIPADQIVPVFQEFGQLGRTDGGSVYYRMPTSDELTTLLATWASLVPSPAFDYVYSYGVQCDVGGTCPAPQALENHPELDPIVTAHNL